MADERDTIVVGFDLGHGETAVTTAHVDKTTPPNVLDLGGATGTGRQHVTAVAEHPARGVLVGVEAAEAIGITSLYLGFKGPELDRDEVRRPVRLFVDRIRDDVVSRSMLPKARRSRWVFGAPSGWSPNLRREYATLLKGVGLDDVEVTPESRAALLYARETAELTVSRGQLAGVVLIVDIGSSTTDFTSVVGHKDRPIDQGTRLGAALIDRTILAHVLANHPDRDLIEEVLQDDRFERLRLELTCRQAKEAFFRTDPNRFVADPNAKVATIRKVTTPRRTVYFEVELSAADMDEVLNAPQPTLEGRSWREAFRDDLQAAATTVGQRPDVVLLTGGASRMHFVLELTRDVFGADRVVLGSEPEVAIARGLALAGRMSIRATGFRTDVRRLIEGKQISALVTERLPELAQKLGEAATTGITERQVIPAFGRWRAGQIATLDQMASDIATEIHADLTDPDNPSLAAVIAEWQNQLRPDLEELTRPVCNRWNIPPAAMSLPHVKVTAGGLTVPFETAAATEALDTLGDIVNVVVAGVVATTLFGAGTALIAATGPFGVIVAALVVGGFLGTIKESAMEKAKSSNLPLWMRRVGNEEKLYTKLRGEAPANEAVLASQLAEQFLSDGGPKLVRDISRGISKELDALAAEAELLIA
jgi:hypothetical protein